MPTWLIIVLAVLFLLFVGGVIARAMLQKRTQGEFDRQLEQANHDLAEAAAADRGWDRQRLEDAARRIYAEQRGSEPTELLLVEVLDRPGTDEDQAVFRCGGEGSQLLLTLDRRGDDWVLGEMA